MNSNDIRAVFEYESGESTCLHSVTALMVSLDQNIIRSVHRSRNSQTEYAVLVCHEITVPVFPRYASFALSMEVITAWRPGFWATK